MQGTAFTLGPRLDLTDAESLVVGAFVGQRRRLLATARALPEADWKHSSRCAAWDARELVLHVLGATDACRTTLTGEHSVFGGSFDPNSSPNVFVESRSGEPVATTVDHLGIAIDRASAAIDAARVQTPALHVTAVWGEEIDWRLFVTHMFWDAWIHERDLLVPLGREPESVDAEVRLAVAYALHSAAIMLGLLGQRLDITLALDGPGRAQFRATADGTNVKIAVAPLDPAAPINGETIAVTDAIAGRGEELSAVLDAPADAIDGLAQLGAFLRGQTAPPVTRH